MGCTSIQIELLQALAVSIEMSVSTALDFPIPMRVAKGKEFEQCPVWGVKSEKGCLREGSLFLFAKRIRKLEAIETL